MGKTLMGSYKKGSQSLLTPEQQGLLSSLVQGPGQELGGAYSQFLAPQSMENYQDLFQQTYIDPAMQQYERSVLPAIQQRFVDANAGSSSALNQALAQSASDLSTTLGSQFGQFYNQEQMKQLQAMGLLSNLLTGQYTQPYQQQQQGLAGPLIGAGAELGGAAILASALSSEKAKENIRDYYKGLDEISDLEVKQYDYKEEFGGEKDKVGVIAEHLPPEITIEKEGMLHVDIYGLVGLLINSVKELQARIEDLEDR